MGVGRGLFIYLKFVDDKSYCVSDFWEKRQNGFKFSPQNTVIIPKAYLFKYDK